MASSGSNPRGPHPEMGQHSNRPLGNMEALYQHCVENINASVCHHVILVAANQKLRDEKVKKAFSVMTSRQEALRLRVIRDETVTENSLGYRFAPRSNPDEIDFRSAALENKDDWISLLHEVSKEHLDPINGPLWRVTFAPVTSRSGSSDVDLNFQHLIILTIHHAIVDAKSGFDFLYRQYLPMLSAILNEKDTSDIVPFLPFGKSCEDALIGHNSRTPWYMKAAIGLLRWKGRTFGKGTIVELKYEDEPSRADVDVSGEAWALPILFSKEMTSAIVKSSKSHGVSVHSVLLVASSIAFCSASEEAKVKIPSSVATGWPIDLRGHAGMDSPQVLGAIHGTGRSTVPGMADCTPKRFWAVCKKIYAGVKSGITLKNTLRSVSMLSYIVNNLRDINMFELVGEIGITQHSMISNLGNCDAGPVPQMTDGEVRIQLAEYYRAVTGTTITNLPPYFYHTIATVQGQMSWVCEINTHLVSQKFAKIFLEKIQETLGNFCS